MKRKRNSRDGLIIARTDAHEMEGTTTLPSKYGGDHYSHVLLTSAGGIAPKGTAKGRNTWSLPPPPPSEPVAASSGEAK